MYFNTCSIKNVKGSLSLSTLPAIIKSCDRSCCVQMCFYIPLDRSSCIDRSRYYSLILESCCLDPPFFGAFSILTIKSCGTVFLIYCSKNKLY